MTQLVSRVSAPLALLLQEMTPGSGLMVSMAEHGGEEHSTIKDVVAKLRGIGGIK